MNKLYSGTKITFSANRMPCFIRAEGGEHEKGAAEKESRRSPEAKKGTLEFYNDEKTGYQRRQELYREAKAKIDELKQKGDLARSQSLQRLIDRAQNNEAGGDNYLAAEASKTLFVRMNLLSNPSATPEMTPQEIIEFNVMAAKYGVAPFQMDDVPAKRGRKITPQEISEFNVMAAKYGVAPFQMDDVPAKRGRKITQREIGDFKVMAVKYDVEPVQTDSFLAKNEESKGAKTVENDGAVATVESSTKPAKVENNTASKTVESGTDAAKEKELSKLKKNSIPTAKDLESWTGKESDKKVHDGLVKDEIKTESDKAIKNYLGLLSEKGLTGDNVNIIKATVENLAYDYFTRTEENFLGMRDSKEAKKYVTEKLIPKLLFILGNEGLGSKNYNDYGLENPLKRLEAFSDFAELGIMKEGKIQQAQFEKALKYGQEYYARALNNFKKYCKLGGGQKGIETPKTKK